MPPRVPGPQGLKNFTLCLRPALAPQPQPLQPLIQKATLTKKEKKRISKMEPYRWQQMEARRIANVERQNRVKVARDAQWGHPVHGITTPFVESFDSAGQAPLSTPRTDEDGNALEEAHPLPTSPHIRNMLLSRDELDAAMDWSYQLARPLEDPNADPNVLGDPRSGEMQAKAHEDHHRKASIALERITSLDNASTKHKRHANIQRCVDAFGRHVTDQTLRLPPKAPLEEGGEDLVKTPRAGPDTGSSEVQIAILTAKIRVLAKAYEGYRGHKDKFNRRNLRLLCHRRQKLLKYMERKEGGSERWNHMIQTLGLSPATWKEQISV